MEMICQGNCEGLEHFLFGDKWKDSLVREREGFTFCKPLGATHSLAGRAVLAQWNADGSGDGLETFVVACLVDEEILLPLGTRLCVVAEKDVVESETQQFLRGKERHTSLLGRAVAFSLIALYARSYKILRSVLAALCPRQNVIERQILCVPMVAAILASIAVANIDAGALHRILAGSAAQVYVMPQSDNGRHGEDRRRRMQHIVAVILLDEHSSAEPQADGASDTDRSKRFIRKVQ